MGVNRTSTVPGPLAETKEITPSWQTARNFYTFIIPTIQTTVYKARQLISYFNQRRFFFNVGLGFSKYTTKEFLV